LASRASRSTRSAGVGIWFLLTTDPLLQVVPGSLLQVVPKLSTLIFSGGAALRSDGTVQSMESTH
jgi:hypothetical protein